MNIENSDIFRMQPWCRFSKWLVLCRVTGMLEPNTWTAGRGKHLGQMSTTGCTHPFTPTSNVEKTRAPEGNQYRKHAQLGVKPVPSSESDSE